VKLACYRKR